MKRINVRFVMLVLTALVVCGGIVFVVHRFQTRRYADFFSERAAKAEAAGNLADAAQDLNLYLGLRPDDNAARVRLGLVLADAGQNYAAFATLEPALRNLQEDDPTARLRLVDVLLQLQRWKDARAHLQDYLLKSKPEDPEYLDRLAQCQLADKELAEAKKSLERAIAKAPQQVGSYVKLVTMLEAHPEFASQTGDTKQDALYWCDQLLDHNPLSISGYLLRAQVRLATLSPSIFLSDAESEKAAANVLLTMAVADTEQALLIVHQAQSDIASVLGTMNEGSNTTGALESLQRLDRNLASVSSTDRALDEVSDAFANGSISDRTHNRLRQIDATLKVLDFEGLILSVDLRTKLLRLIKGTPEPAEIEKARTQAIAAASLRSADERPYQSLAELELLAGNRSEALNWLRQGSQKTTSKSGLPIVLARLLLEDKKIEEAGNLVASMKQQYYPVELTDYLSARIAYANGEWPVAERLLTDARLKAIASPNLLKEIEYWLGLGYARQELYSLATEALRRALSIDSQYTEARLLLAETLRSEGNVEESLQQYRLVLGESPEASLKELQLRIEQDRRLPTSTLDWKAVNLTLEALANALPDRADISILQAEAYYSQGKVADAQRVLESASSKHPHMIDVQLALAELLIQQRKFDNAEQLLNAIGETGDTTVVRVVRAKLEVRRDATKAGPVIRKLSENADHFSKEARAVLWRELSLLATACEDPEGAINLCVLAAEVMPDDQRIWLQLLAMALDSRNEKLIERAMTEIQRTEGRKDGPVWSYCMAARLLSERGDDQQRAKLTDALAYVGRALRERPAWSEALVLAASIEEQLGRPNEAIRSLLQVIESGQAGPATMRDAMRLLLAQGRLTEASEVLARLERQSPSLIPDVQRYRTRTSALMDDFDAALPIARQIAAQSTNSQDHVWLSQLCMAAAAKNRKVGAESSAIELTEEAERAWSRASELAPDDPIVWISRVTFLVACGRHDKVRSTLEQVKHKFTDVPGLLARLYVAGQLNDDAITQFIADLSKWPDNIELVRQASEFSYRIGRPLPTRETLERIVSYKLRATPADVEWARRMLALNLRQEGGIANLNSALLLVEANLKDNPDSILDTRTKAILLSAHPLRNVRSEACKLMEELVQKDTSGSSETRARLAEMYVSEGRWEDSIRHFQVLTDASSMALYIQGLIGRKQLAEAEVAWNRMQSIAPSDPRTTALHADLLFAKEDFESVLGSESTPGILDDLLNAAKHDFEMSAKLAAIFERYARQLETSPRGDLASQFLAKSESIWRDLASTGGTNERLGLAAFLARNNDFQTAVSVAADCLNTSEPAVFASLLTELTKAASNDPTRLFLVDELAAKAQQRFGSTSAMLAAILALRMQQGQFEAAKDTMRSMLRAEPDNPVLKNNLAELLALRGDDLDEAITLINEAIDKAGPLAAMLDTRGMVHLARADFDASVEDFRAAVAEAPSGNRYFHLAQALIKKGGETDQAAKEAWKRATELGVVEANVHPLELKAYQDLRLMME